MNADSHPSYLKDLVTTCQQNQIDGIVLRQTLFDDEARKALQLIREIDPSITVISEGRLIRTGQEIEDRIQAGATLTTVCDALFFKKHGPYAIYDMKRELIDLRKQKFSSQ